MIQKPQQKTSVVVTNCCPLARRQDVQKALAGAAAQPPAQAAQPQPSTPEEVFV